MGSELFGMAFSSGFKKTGCSEKLFFYRIAAII